MSEPESTAPLPKIIRPDDAPLTLYTRPRRAGETDRYEPGDGLVRNLIDNERYQVGIWEALPGESFWTDCHPTHEFLYIIEGEATILVPSRREAVVARAGEVVAMPPGTDHQTMNRGSSRLRLLFCSPPDAIAT